MLDALKKRWGVRTKDLVVILCVFAITGTTTAYLSKMATAWAGFTDETHWGWKWLLRLGMLVIGYQVVLLTVAFLLGQFPFFWRYEKRLLTRLGFFKKSSASPNPRHPSQ